MVDSFLLISLKYIELVCFKEKYKSFISGGDSSENRMLRIEKSLYMCRVSLESYVKCVNSSRRSGILHLLYYVNKKENVI